MQWIKYQILSNNNPNNPIFVSKRVGYSEANLNIAKAEAYEGKYEIENDGNDYRTKPMPIELGGTGASTPEKARKNLGAASEADAIEYKEYVKSTAVMMTVEGSHVLIDGALPFENKVKVRVRDTSLKNLIPFIRSDGKYGYEFCAAGETITHTASGKTLKVNNDGSITINSTKTNTDRFTLYSSSENLLPFIGGKYYSKIIPTGVQLQFISTKTDGGNYTVISYNASNGLFRDDIASFKIDLSISSIIENLTIYPMFVEGKMTLTESDYLHPADLDPKPTAIVKTSGKNLLTYPYDEFTIEGTKEIIKDGITFTDNGDGTITVNGTAGGNVFLSLKKKNEIYINLPNHDMWLSGCPFGGSQGTYAMRLIDNRPSPADSKGDFGSGVKIPAGFSYNEVYIRIQAGHVCNNLVFKPQIEYGEIATEYVPYTSEGETKVVNVDETVEVDNIVPSMAISSGSDIMILTAEYPERADKTFERLTQAIISFGGKV